MRRNLPASWARALIPCVKSSRRPRRRHRFLRRGLCGKVHGLKRAVRLAARGERLFAVFTVGLADADESYRKQLEASVRAACPERLLPRLKQYRLRGRLNEPALKGGDKFLLRLLHTAAEKTPASEQTPEMRALLAAPADLPDLAPLKELKEDIARDISSDRTRP